MKTLVQIRMVSAIDETDLESRLNEKLKSLDIKYGDKLLIIRDIKYTHSVTVSFDHGKNFENFSALIIFEVKGD